MPKTSVDEDGDLEPLKIEVGSSINVSGMLDKSMTGRR
jgi:hypothetical protein